MFRSVLLVVACLAATAPAAWAQEPPRPKNAGGAAAGPASDAVADLVNRLASEDAAVRSAAATRLGASYPDGATAAPVLLELVSDPDALVRTAARKAIGDLAARGLADLATYFESVRKPGPARDAWLAAESEASELGLAWTPTNLAISISDARRAKGDAAVRRETAALALGAASALRSPGRPESPLHVIRAASRSAGAGTRPLAAAAVAVLTRAELVHRRFAGDPTDLPTADDAKAVARIAALIDPAQKLDPAVQAAFGRVVPTLLTINYGHADPGLVKRLESIPDSDSAFLALSWIDVANLVGLGRPIEKVLADAPPLDSPDVRHSFLASVCVRRADAAKHVAAIRRDYLKSPDLRRRAVGAILILHLDPRDAEAGPALFELVAILGKDSKGLLEGRERRELLQFVTTWIPRLPDPPIGFAEQLWVSSPKDPDDATESAILGALVPSIRREPQLPGYLQRRYFPDEGEPKRALQSEYASDLLSDALAASGAVGSKMLEAWARRLTAGAGADPLESIESLGPTYPWNCPERQLRWLAAAGPRGQVAVPAIQPFLRSPDPLERYLAAVALARIGKQ